MLCAVLNLCVAPFRTGTWRIEFSLCLSSLNIKKSPIFELYHLHLNPTNFVQSNDPTVYSDLSSPSRPSNFIQSIDPNTFEWVQNPKVHGKFMGCVLSIGWTIIQYSLRRWEPTELNGSTCNLHTQTDTSINKPQ